MDITIHTVSRPPHAGDFHYGNMPSRYGANTWYFTKDGKPYTIVAGELHFSRLPAERWRETLLKMRECGLNTVSNYVFWNYHEEVKDEFDFSGDRDIARFLELCQKLSMPCILRIGPWCHGEVVRGGFPERIDCMEGKRSNDPAYLAEVRDFWKGLYRYKLTLPADVLENRFDVKLVFDFDGLNLQVFSGKTLINDYFNIDRKFEMYLRDYRQYLDADSTLIIRTAPKTADGISNVYNEIPIPLDSDRLVLTSAQVIERKIIEA